MRDRRKVAAILSFAALAFTLAMAGSSIADKAEIKNIGFDLFFTDHPSENPEMMEVFEGESLKVVLHQNEIFGSEGLEMPAKHLMEKDVAYFLYPGNYCARDCLVPDVLATPGQVYPFAHTYYVLSPPPQGQNAKIVLLQSAEVRGDNILERSEKKAQGKKGKKGALPAPDSMPEGEDEAHPIVEAVPLDAPAGEPFAPPPGAVPAFGGSYDEGSGESAYGESSTYPGSDEEGFDGLPADLRPSLIEKYFFKAQPGGGYCHESDQALSYVYWVVGDDGTVVKRQPTITIPAWGGGRPASLYDASRWLDEALAAHEGEYVVASLTDSGTIVLKGRKPQPAPEGVDSGRLPPGTVLKIMVLKSGRCAGTLLGFSESRIHEYQFPYTSEIPDAVYEAAPMISDLCIVDEALTDSLRPQLPDDEKKVFRCTFDKVAALDGPFWAFFTYEAAKKIQVKKYPIVVQSNKMQISNVEARVSFEGSPEVGESFHHPTSDMPIFYYSVPKAKPGVYAITPVITLEDPALPPGERTEVKAGHVMYVKVMPRENMSFIRLQMGIIAFNELRAMAFTVMLTPVLNKSFFKRKFFPAPYPMPHIGIRLGSQSDGGVIGLQVGIGIALLKEFIIVGGIQFGTADITTPWDWRKAWYIGVAIDPWLLQKSLSQANGGGD